MDLLLNKARPLIMHIDINSCFATIEQQANPLYRRKPLVVAAYDTPRGMILAASYDAKAKGIKLGLSVAEARAIEPGIIVLMPDPSKYREAHKKFQGILLEYTSSVVAKSIDEFVIDFQNSPSIREGRDLVDIGYEIKHKIKDRIGCYVTVNVGIGTNRFWAKTAAGLDKPDGLNAMNADNALEIYQRLSLLDLHGINYRYKARLNAAGIFTPLQFFESSAERLKRTVFHSIVGNHWFYRLHGWEVDNVTWDKKSIGHQYAIGQKTKDINKLYKLLMKLTHKVGRRMRKYGYSAGGVHLAVSFQGGYRYAKGYTTKSLMYSSQDIYHYAKKLLLDGYTYDIATYIAISVYGLVRTEPEQTNIFKAIKMDHKALSDACDIINDRWGEFTIIPAMMTSMDDLILDRIAFGSVRDVS